MRPRPSRAYDRTHNDVPALSAGLGSRLEDAFRVVQIAYLGIHRLLDHGPHQQLAQPGQLGIEGERQAGPAGDRGEVVAAMGPRRPGRSLELESTARLEDRDLVVSGNPTAHRPAHPLGVLRPNTLAGDPLDVDHAWPPLRASLAVRDERETSSIGRLIVTE